MIKFDTIKLTRISVIFILIFSGCSAENEYETAHKKFINSRLESLLMKKNSIIDLMGNIEEDQKNGKEQDIIVYKWSLLLNNVDIFLEESKITIDSMIVKNELIEYVNNSRTCIGIISAGFHTSDVEMKHYIINQNFDNTKVMLNQMEILFIDNFHKINANLEQYLQEIAR